MAMWVIEGSAIVPCQWFSRDGIQTASPGRMVSINCLPLDEAAAKDIDQSVKADDGCRGLK